MLKAEWEAELKTFAERIKNMRKLIYDRWARGKIYVCVYVRMYVCICVCVCSKMIEREKERERERASECVCFSVYERK